jgi:sugar (pentulose or hexulose) kinase
VLLLGLDLGTTNVKAVVVRPDGTIVARGSAPVQTWHIGEDGVEQDIEDIWSALLAAVAEAGRGRDLSQVAAVGVSGQGGALQLLDSAARPVGRVVSWLDGRGRPYDSEVTRELGPEWFAAHTGHGHSGLAVGQLLRLRDASPELVERPSLVGFVGDVVVGRLCGRRAHDATSLSICILYNPTTRTADRELLEHIGIAEEQLPDLIAPAEPAGGLSEEPAAALGLPPGIPVSGAIHDQYAAALGSGAVRAGDVMFGAGTAWVLLAAAGPESGAHPIVPQAFVCTHVVEGLYGHMLSMVNGGSAFAWAQDLLGLAGRSGAEMDDLLDSVPPGSEGVRFVPLLTAGGAGASFHGLRFGHSGPHLLRAVTEGLAMELARHLAFLLDGRIAVRRLAMCGGAAVSRVTPQIVSDATGVEVACVTEGEVSALGAAVVARALAERTRDLRRLSEEMTPGVRVCSPGRDAGTYRTVFGEHLALRALNPLGGTV